jgi:hypothetical protein
MTKYLKGKDGRFSGSIGDGKTHIPTTAPVVSTQNISSREAEPSEISIEEQYSNYQEHYFSQDGNYGDANSLNIIDTSDWTSEDWDLIDETSDYDRADVAREISDNKLSNSSTR